MNKGFFTIEMLLAIGLLSMLSATILSYHVLNVYWQNESIKRNYALMAIASFIDAFQLPQQKATSGELFENNIQLSWDLKQIQYIHSKNYLLNETTTQCMFLLSIQASWHTLYNKSRKIAIETIII